MSEHKGLRERAAEAYQAKLDREAAEEAARRAELLAYVKRQWFTKLDVVLGLDPTEVETHWDGTNPDSIRVTHDGLTFRLNKSDGLVLETTCCECGSIVNTNPVYSLETLGALLADRDELCLSCSYAKRRREEAAS